MPYLYVYARALLFAIFLSLIGLPAMVAVAAPPALAPFTLHYHARYLSFSGQGTLSLHASAPGQWRYTLNIEHPLASLSQSTLFEAHHEGLREALRPLSNRSHSAVPFRHRTVNGHFDWHAREASWSGDAKPSRRGPVALQAGDLDGLLINLAVVRDLAQAPTQAQPPALRYRMVEGGRARNLAYQIVGTETLTVGKQALRATRLERHDRDKQQIAWVVAGIPAPVRLLQREDGKDVLELRLARLPPGILP